MVNKPRLDSALRVFKPVFAAFDQLATGEIETVRGAPVFKDWSGEWCELAPAIDGWADCWDRICRNQGIDINLEPLRKLARKLDYGAPLTEDDVSSARAVIDATWQAYIRLPVEITRSHAQTEEIAIAFDRMGIREAA
ncbi:hypothetical protein [Azonexus hydrophilus]|uniref:hypothetical protein n=1 Tax=Azonexus hydrophilus TaxID=418702 RepID=UPI00248FE4C0|nr:hypothetical protein [Azonexus hydrophilus]